MTRTLICYLLSHVNTNPSIFPPDSSFFFFTDFPCLSSIPQAIMLRYLYLIASQLKWALDFLLHYSFFPNQHFDMPGRSEELCLDSYEFSPAEGCMESKGCAVCLCSIEEGEEITALRCDHLFHKVCLDRWLGFRRATCPLCRDFLGPRRAIAELGMEVLVFSYCSLDSSERDA
ncbi:E3 ubiquitin-protein ligase RHA2B [Salix suchowensis]|nr:E3 ubiquitin-protein ligase RHA2B [Salix suchowensis]